MLAYAIEAIRTKYSKSSNPEQFKLLKVLHSPNTKEAIITFFKVRALYGHKQHWIPTLGLQSMSPQDRVNLCEELFKIQHPSDKESIANNPLPAALSGERSRISPRLVAQLIAANYEDLERHDRKLVLEPSVSGAERYRWSSTCKGLWYKINNQHLYESVRLLEERHPEVFFLIRYRLFSERKSLVYTPSLGEGL